MNETKSVTKDPICGLGGFISGSAAVWFRLEATRTNAIVTASRGLVSARYLLGI